MQNKSRDKNMSSLKEICRFLTIFSIIEALRSSKTFSRANLVYLGTTLWVVKSITKSLYEHAREQVNPTKSLESQTNLQCDHKSY